MRSTGVYEYTSAVYVYMRYVTCHSKACIHSLHLRIAPRVLHFSAFHCMKVFMQQQKVLTVVQVAVHQISKTVIIVFYFRYKKSQDWKTR